MARHLIFVYGTLKRGEPNHHVISKYDETACKFIGVAKTENKYPLVIASRYNIPFLLLVKGTGKNITGEVYEVNDEILDELDKFENHPEYYIRKDEYVQIEETSERLLVGMYFLPNFKPELLELPFLSDYSSDGDHGLKYVTRYEKVRRDNEPYIVDVRKQ